LLAPAALTYALVAAGGPRSREYTFLYLGLVAIVAVWSGLGPSLVAAVASFGLIDYYLVPPLHTFSIADEQDIVNLVVLLGAAGMVGGLGSLRRGAQLRSEALAGDLTRANRKLERLNREQAEAAHLALRLAVTEEQVKALEESDRVRRDFLANVSHDLRTPISTILTGSTAIANDPATNLTTRKAMESIEGEARRLNAVVTDMLDMARIEGNALDLHLEPLDLRVAVASAVDRARRGGSNHEFTLPDEGVSVLVLADWARLGQVLDNLLNNADRAAPTSTAIEVTVSTDPVRGAGVVRVHDSGPGIPAALGDRVFERFVRGNGANSGTGLGLSIVKGLTEAQGGRAWIETAGTGATMAFSLPLATVQDGA
jgi:K+-sensing histidine kinase KdpD